MAEIIIADITAHNGSTTTVLRFATQGYVTGGRNLLAWSENFANADWTKSNVTLTSGQTSPQDTATAYTVTDSDAANLGYLQRASTTVAINTVVVGSWFVKKDAIGRATRFPTLRISFGAAGANGNAEVYFDTSTGESSYGSTGTTTYVGHGVVDFGGWWRVWIACSNSVGTACNFTLFPALGASASWVASAATTGNVTAWGAQLDYGSAITPYMPTAGATAPDFYYYDGRIQQPGNVQRAVFGSRRTFGASEVGYGELVLVNSDGALDAFLSYGFAGWPITIKRGVVKPNSRATPTWTTLLTGVMESADFSWTEVSIKVRDRQQELTKPLQATRFAGNNSLPAGLEGVSTDLKGKPKPILYGKAFNFLPPCVNTTRRIYQLSEGLIQSVDAVYDRGAVMTAGAAYSSQADMETNAPSAGQYRAWLNAAGSYIRLGSAPAGTLTVDATQGAAASNRTAAQLMSTIMQKGGIASADISSADITALDTANSAVVGVWLGHDREWTGVEALDAMANSVGAWWGVDRFGAFRMARIVDPSGGISIGTITAVDILKIDRIRSTDEGRGIPAWQCKLNHTRYSTVQSEFGASATDTLKAERVLEARTSIASDAAVKTQWPKAVEIEFDTYLTSSSDADTEVTRRLNLYKVQRDTLQVRARLDDTIAAVIDIGSVLTLQLSRFTYGAGKKLLVTGIRTDLRNNIFDLTLWG